MKDITNFEKCLAIVTLSCIIFMLGVILGRIGYKEKSLSEKNLERIIDGYQGYFTESNKKIESLKIQLRDENADTLYIIRINGNPNASVVIDNQLIK